MLARKIRIRKLTPMGHETVMADPEDVLPIIEEALMQRRFVFCEPMRVMVRNLNEARRLMNDLQEVVIMPPVAGGCSIHFHPEGPI